jgi:hypothetical protein
MKENDQILDLLTEICNFSKDMMGMIGMQNRAVLIGKKWSAYTAKYNALVDTENQAMNNVPKVVLAQDFITGSGHDGFDGDHLSNIIGAIASFASFMETNDDNFVFGL